MEADPDWKNYKEETSGSTLIELIQLQQELIIASDGSKSKIKSVGAWILADSSNNNLIPRSNPNFGPITSIDSHRSNIWNAIRIIIPS